MVTERSAEVFDESGNKHTIVYSDLTWLQGQEATNKSFTYKNGMPDHLEPMTLATERMIRMIKSIDGVPFTKEHMYSWSEVYGMNIASTIGAFGGESEKDNSFRNKTEEIHS